MDTLLPVPVKPLVALVAAVVVLAGGVLPTRATHSLPGFPYFWDYDVDGIAEASDSVVYFQQGGSLWNATKSARFDEALAAWRNGTDFNPSRVASGSLNVVYVDGRVPVPCLDEWPPGAVAANCIVSTYRGTYRQITNSKIYLNEANYNFSFDDDPPASGLYDGAGIFTHELGHAVRLIDLYGSGNCPPGPTMCGSTTPSQSFSLRSLSSDDIGAADAVYLP